MRESETAIPALIAGEDPRSLTKGGLRDRSRLKAAMRGLKER
jgi:hypothetical protein